MQTLGAHGKLLNSLITNKMRACPMSTASALGTTRFKNSPCTPFIYMPFSRSTAFSRLKKKETNPGSKYET